jgi:hypothetical protein
MLNTKEIRVICIPRVLYEITEKEIKNVFTKLNLGTIQKIDIVVRYTEKGDKYKRVFVHIRNWYLENTLVANIKKKLLEGKEIKVVYAYPWFWKISAYKCPLKVIS